MGHDLADFLSPCLTVNPVTANCYNVDMEKAATVFSNCWRNHSPAVWESQSIVLNRISVVSFMSFRLYESSVGFEYSKWCGHMFSSKCIFFKTHNYRFIFVPHIQNSQIILYFNSIIHYIIIFSFCVSESN